MSENDPFDAMAPAYDLLLDQARLDREVPAIAQRLDLRPGMRLCDLGCGTGAHLAALRERCGITGTGIDAAEGMIATARARHPALTWHIGDLREPPQTDWDALLCIGNVLACLPPDNDLSAVFRSWFASLRPGGGLLLQLLTPLDAEEQRLLVRRDTQRILSKQLLGLPDGALLSLILHSRSGTGWDSRAEHQRLALHPPDHLIAALTAAGFNDIHHSADLAGSAPAAQDQTIVISAWRPA